MTYVADLVFVTKELQWPRAYAPNCWSIPLLAHRQAGRWRMRWEHSAMPRAEDIPFVLSTDLETAVAPGACAGDAFVGAGK